MRLETYELDIAQGATGEGAPQTVEELMHLTVQTTGVFVASVDIETSVDGTSWVIAATITAGGLTTINGVHKKIRTNVTAHTSGQAVVHLAGLNHRTT